MARAARGGVPPARTTASSSAREVVVGDPDRPWRRPPVSRRLRRLISPANGASRLLESHRGRSARSGGGARGILAPIPSPAEAIPPPAAGTAVVLEGAAARRRVWVT